MKSLIVAAFLAVFVSDEPAPLPIQKIDLIETAKAGDYSRYTLDLMVTGNLIVTQDGGKLPVKLEAKGRHRFAEQTIAAEGGMPTLSARYYEEATAEAVVGGDKSDRKLTPERRLIAVRRDGNGLLCYSPAGTLTREELDLVTEHFNPQCLPGLLPGKAVAIGESWAISDAAAQAACLLDGVVKNGLSGRVTSIRDGVAQFEIEGLVEGSEQGAKVSLTVHATGQFDSKAKRVTEISWKQSDDREQGPVNPASKLEAHITLKREVLGKPVDELADLPATVTATPPATLTNLRHADPKGRYSFVYPREWHITGQTGDHLVLRLLDGGEFIAQATLSQWKPAAPGSHLSADDFKNAIAQAPAWVATKTLEDGEIPTKSGCWLYRFTAEGQTENVAVVQAFFLLAGPAGDQMAITFTAKPEKAKDIDKRGVNFVEAIEFGKK
jgi:hypothetical protein